MSKIKLYMGLPSTGDRHDGQVYLLRRLEKKYGDRIEFIYPDAYVGRIFHDRARNAYVEQFLASKADVLWFLDADVIPPDRVLDLITEHWDKWKLAGASYPVWMPPPGSDTPQCVFTVYSKDPVSGKMHPARVPTQGLVEVDGMATGCIFIKREVFEKLTKPYFEFKYDNESREIIEGEDLGFCKKTSDLGYKFFTDFSMACHHYKRISLLDVSNAIIESQQQAINACDKQLRQILAKQTLERAASKRPKSSLILP